MAKNEAGYNLVEVLVAIAITAVVLLTVITLFYMGRRNVYSGKQMTVASSVGTRVLEDLSTMTASDIQTHFGLNDSPNPLAAVTLTGLTTVNTTLSTAGAYGSASGVETFPNSVTRDTTACTATMAGTVQTITCADPAGGNTAYDQDKFLAKWYGMIVPGTDASAVLTSPIIGLVITPRNPTNLKSNAACTCPVTTAQFYKVRAYVSWLEGPTRRRYAFFDTTKVNRGPF